MYNNLTESEKRKIEEFLKWLREHPEKLPEVKAALSKY